MWLPNGSSEKCILMPRFSEVATAHPPPPQGEAAWDAHLALPTLFQFTSGLNHVIVRSTCAAFKGKWVTPALKVNLFQEPALRGFKRTET